MGKKTLTIDYTTGKYVLETIVDNFENAKGNDNVAYSAKAVDNITNDIKAKKANKNGDISTDFKTKTLTVSDNILPSKSGLSIGDEQHRFSSIYVNEAYLSTNTLYLGDTPIMGTEKDTIMIRSDRDQSINMKTTGIGSTNILSEHGVSLSTSGSNSDVIVQATGQGSRAVLSANNTVEMNAPHVNMTGDVNVSGPMRTKSVTIDGNLIVNGDTVTVNSQTIQTKDNIIEVNYGQIGSGVTAGQAGIKVNRGDAAPYFMVFDETDDMFKVGMVGNLQTIASQDYVLSTRYIHPEKHNVSMITGLSKIATSGSYNDLSDTPKSLPANGGNADTLDGKHASDFLLKTWLPQNDHIRKHSITSASDHNANAWKMFYSNGSGQITEIGLGSANQILKFNGNSAPTPVNEYELNVTTITKSLTLTKNWTNTGIEGTSLSTGSYMIQVTPTDHTATNQYHEYYTGTMSWYSGSTNSTETDEIILHKAGHAPNSRHIYLRVARHSSGILKLQIAFTEELKTATNITFKFKRMI